MKLQGWLLLCLLLSLGAVGSRGEDPVDEDPIHNDDDEFADLGDDDADPPPIPDDEVPDSPPPLNEEEAAIDPIDFVTPSGPRGAYFADAFPDSKGLGSKWIVSEAKKDGAEEDLAKYNGEWEITTPEKVLLTGDLALVLKTKARHAAVSAKLAKPFKFSAGKPLIVQYDVKFQNGQECGGAYIKLLVDQPSLNLKQYTDKTPYSIMFGPDKCGMTTKIHTIFRFTNPANGSTNEHHANQGSKNAEDYVTDKKSHLYRLEVEPNGHYKVSVDNSEIYSGELATGDALQPPIFQPKEIPDPNEKKPKDWDEREKIPDPEAKKPEDWDEDAPETIPDEDATMPSDWLEEEESLIPDPKAERPDDWDSEMDGEWEAPRISNPKCEGISGCGKWERPSKKNPAYKGKWKAPKIDNPNYQGKWKPQNIPNPAYFESDDPFSMLLPIGAVGLELWTMSEDMAFDNFLITSEVGVAKEWAAATWAPKAAQESAAAAKGGFVGGLVDQAKEKPWLWAVYLLVALIPIVGIVVWCSKDSTAKSAAPEHPKKTDEAQPDDEEEAPKLQAKQTKDSLEDDEDEEEEEEEEEEVEAEPKPSTASATKRNLRQRKAD